MRGILLALVLLGALVSIAPAAEAHETYCVVGDVDCYLECRTRDLKHLVSPQGHCYMVAD